jgi:putative signal transducing protein
MELVTVFRAFNPADAQLVRSRLEAAEFHPVVMHELSSLSLDGYALAAGGILVQVPDEEVADAREFLASPPPGESGGTP